MTSDFTIFLRHNETAVFEQCASPSQFVARSFASLDVFLKLGLCGIRVDETTGPWLTAMFDVKIVGAKAEQIAFADGVMGIVGRGLRRCVAQRPVTIGAEELVKLGADGIVRHGIVWLCFTCVVCAGFGNRGEMGIGLNCAASAVAGAHVRNWWYFKSIDW